MAHAILTSLLAKAMVVLFIWFVLSCFLIQTLKPSGLSPTLLTADRAPCTSKVRRYRSPRFEMPDSLVLPPVPVSPGTKPILALASRPHRKAEPFPILT